jgi:serine/threonine protein kinase
MINEKYIIRSSLGKGRSAVYLCYDIDFPGKDIAIKILPPNSDETETAAFKNEFFTLRKLVHPNIIQVNDTGRVLKCDDDEYKIEINSEYFALEFFEGAELANSTFQKSEENLLAVITQLCSALYYLHQSNFIYYDLKPENILIAEINGSPFIKLIDFGFARNIVDTEYSGVRGTAQYIAPELLKKEPHDHRVDLYSLGILLYKIIYDKFPFDAENELEIFKAQVDSEFEFPDTPYSKKLIDVIKKLLEKDPSQRYFNSLQVLFDLGVDVNDSVANDLIPASIFANRKDILNILRTYISDETSTEVFSLKGSEGAGKTAVIYELFSEIDKVVLVRNDNSKTGFEFLKTLLRKIVYKPFVYPQLTDKKLEIISRIFSDTPADMIEELKSIFTLISLETNFTLILEDFNRYDDFTIEILREIIPIFQVHKIKVILTENSDLPYFSTFIHNRREVNLTPFTEAHVQELIDRSFFEYFPKEELKKMILRFSDLLPGNIEGFIQNLLILKIIKFSFDKIIISAGENDIELLKSSHEAVYRLRYESLTEMEAGISRLISAFGININTEIVSLISGEEIELIIETIQSLQHKNILHAGNTVSAFQFTSEGLKKFIYQKINGKIEFHKKIGKIIEENFPAFNKNELSMQYELGEDYQKSYEVLKNELAVAESIFAFSYEKKLLQHLLTFPLDSSDKIDINLELVKVLIKLSEYRAALKLINKLLSLKLDPVIKKELLILKGSALIEIGELEEGKNLLSEMIEKINNQTRKQKLLVEIASAEFDLNNFDESFALCNSIINHAEALPEDKAKCYSIKALVELYKNNNLNNALSNFEFAEKTYRDAHMRLRVAQMVMNIGNVYNMKGDKKKAEEYWNKSLETNKSIGNLEHEGKILMSQGVLYFESHNFSKASELYERAFSIFESLGHRAGEGWTLINIGEISLQICDYQKAYSSLNKAVEIFEELKNPSELLEAKYFLGVWYFAVGDFENLQKIINEFAKILVNEVNVEKYRDKYEYLHLLNKYANNEFDGIIEPLQRLKKANLDQEDFYHFSRSLIFLTLVKMKLHDFAGALNELNNKNFQDFCRENLLIKSERNYLLGLISASDPDLNLTSPISYFEDALEIINDLNVSELTWKLLAALSEAYYDRGNYSNAKEYGTYAKSVIYFIVDKISNQKIKNIYLSKPERKEFLDKLELFEAQYQNG